jgi:hypothetical protein
MSANAAAADLYSVLAPQMSDRVLSCLGDPSFDVGRLPQIPDRQCAYARCGLGL